MSGTALAVAQPGTGPADTSNVSDDPDDIAIRQAERDIAGLGGGAAPPAVVPPAPAAATPPAPAPEPAAPAAPAANPGSVPYDRFNAVTAANRHLTEEVAYLRGALEATRAQQPAAPAAPAPAPAAPQQPDATAVIAAAQAELLDLAARWEGGQDEQVGSAQAWEQARLGPLARILNARDALNIAGILKAVDVRIEAALNRPGLLDSHALEAQIAALNARHPWLAVMTDENLAVLTRIAQAEATALNRPFPNGPAGTAALRARVAALADRYGPEWYPGTTPPAPAAPAAGAPAQPTAPQPPAAPPSPTRPTTADILANAERMAAHPPNDPANRGGGDTTLTIERLDGMTDEQIESGINGGQLRDLLGLPRR